METVRSDVDVVVVGGGIAGSALAMALSATGISTLVLERDVQYRDKIRGEVINCWGVAELIELGLEKELLAAGGTYVDRFVGYDETVEPAAAEANALHLDEMVPGIAGVLDVGHPQACEAFAQAATRAGADLRRGANKVTVEPGARPRVAYTHDGRRHEVRCRLVVGADGRMSTVRKQAGIGFEVGPPNSLGGGLLVEDLPDWPVHVTSIGTEDDVLYFVFPRAGDRARLYLLHDTAQKGRFSGPERQRDFLEAFQLSCIPGSEMFARATPSMHCAFYPMNNASTDLPYTEGVVLIGDAAGWTDPIIGQGLSIALRDARLVRDAMWSDPRWTPETFAHYGSERALRMDRLRRSARVRTEINMTFTPEGASRRRTYGRLWPTDPLLAGPRLATFKGAFGVPPESFDDENLERIFALR